MQNHSLVKSLGDQLYVRSMNYGFAQFQKRLSIGSFWYIGFQATQNAHLAYLELLTVDVVCIVNNVFVSEYSFDFTNLNTWCACVLALVVGSVISMQAKPPVWSSVFVTARSGFQNEFFAWLAWIRKKLLPCIVLLLVFNSLVEM